MKPHDAALRALVRQWLDKASAEFSAAEHLSGQSQQFGAIVAFHCQQAAEKFLKGFLVRHQIEFPKTHDIARLLHSAQGSIRTANLLSDADQLYPFGVEQVLRRCELLPGGEIAAIDMACRVKSAAQAHSNRFFTAATRGNEIFLRLLTRIAEEQVE